MSISRKSITQYALLGTERDKPQLKADEPEMTALFQGLSGRTAEEQLLSAAATLFLYEKAGQLPGKTETKVSDIAEAEEFPRCSGKAGGFLREILFGERRRILPEFLHECAKAGKRIPEEEIPSLLEIGRKGNAELKEAIRGVVGHRGLWVARQNPDWSFGAVAEALDKSLWETGTKEERTALLRLLRASDPIAGLELLKTTWSNEPPEERAAFIALLDVGLQSADEDFLEQALSDKRKEVRRGAVNLLAKLPGSKFSHRMIERVKPLVKFVPAGKGKLLRKGQEARFEVALPEAPDKSASRDGIETIKKEGMGERAGWLLQIVSFVPIGFWEQETQQSANSLISAARATDEWGPILLEGWWRATGRLRSEHWAEALLEQSIDAPQIHDNLEEVLISLPDEKAQPFLTSMVQKQGLTEPLIQILQRYHRPWTMALTQRVITCLKETVGNKSNATEWRLRAVIADFGYFLNPAAINQILEGWPTEKENWDFWSSTIENIISTVQFRHDMIEALKEKETK